MVTFPVVQQPNGTNGSGANGNGANGHTPTPCPTGKKPFASREEAERFETENRRRFPNQSKQYAYKCELCPAYHLTSKPPNAFAIGQTSLRRLESLATVETSRNTSANRRERGETEAEVKRLWEQRLSDSEIASQLGITPAAAHYHRKEFGAANSQANGNSPFRESKPPRTMSEYEEQKRLLDEEYQSKRTKLEQHKEQLVEATKLKVSECQEGKALFIRFGLHEHMELPKDKAEELATSLMDWF